MTTAPKDEAQAPEGLIAIEAPKVTKIAGEQAGERTPFTLPPCCTTDCTHTGEDTDEADEDGQLDAETRNRILWATRPKNMLLMYLSARVSAAASGDYDSKLNLYRTFLDSALDAGDGDLIWTRLGDPTDELDEPHMDALISTFMGRWLPGRPTGPLSGQAPLQRGTGRPSTGRARSTARTRKA